jgi:hypothetical protein
MTAFARRRFGWVVLACGMLAGCAERRSACRECGTVVVAAVSEPTSLVPPLVAETVGREI